LPSWVAVDADFIAFSTGATLTNRSLAIATAARHILQLSIIIFYYFLKNHAGNLVKNPTMGIIITGKLENAINGSAKLSSVHIMLQGIA
jgi:hypothetical protein